MKLRSELKSVLRPIRRFVFGLSLVGLCHSAAAAPTEIKLWHSLLGANEVVLSDLVTRYNAQQNNVRVQLEYKGDAETTVESALLAVRNKQAPDLVQVRDDLSERLLNAKGAAKPLSEVLALVKSPDFNFFIPAAVTFMKDAKGQLYGFPLTAAVPVFFYNKDAYRKAGLDPEAPPKTWRELQKHLLALQKPDNEITCEYTTSDPAWIHVENLAAIHGLAIASKNNGLDGAGAQLQFNDLLHVRHMALMESWIKSLLFTYAGHNQEGDARFASGECATLTSASTAYGEFARNARFNFGMAPLPYYEEAATTPLNSQVGGSALWALNGKKPEQYKAVAEFLAWLATPVVATEWHQKTGSLPLTEAAFLVSEKAGFYESRPGFASVMRQATGKPVTRGIRLPQYDKVREVIAAELESVWMADKAPKQGLDDAVRLGNAVLSGRIDKLPLPKAAPSAVQPGTVKKPASPANR